jgi:predicted membrane channel-forming protein YqfA (hemolysin III family)
MNRKAVLTNLIILFAGLLLILTAFEYLVHVFSLTLDAALAYWTQIIYLLSIMLFLLLLVIYIEVRIRSES